MRKICFSICFVLLISQSVWGAGSVLSENNENIHVVTNTAISGISTALAHADIALCRSVINMNHLKGEFGENIVEKLYLENHLQRSGSWEAIAPRLGRQGIDQIYIKYDSRGLPRKIMVGEVKYGTSNLQMTKDGMQLGQRWTLKRLKALANRYMNLSGTSDIGISMRPSKLGIGHEIPVNLKNGRSGVFWRKNALDSWKFEGRREDLPDARKKIETDGHFLRSAGEDRIAIRRRLFEVSHDNNILKIRIKDAAGLEKGLSQNQLQPLQEISLKLSGNEGKTAEIAKQLKSKMGYLSDKECMDYAEKLSRNINKPADSFAASVAKSSLKAGIAGALFTLSIEAVIQTSQGNFNPEHLAESAIIGFGSVGVGSAVGQITTKYLMSSAAHSAVIRTASSIGVSTAYLGNALGSAASMGVTSVLFAYGGYFTGHYDSYTANKLAFTGLVGAGGGALAGSGIMFLATTYGTASTGTAISSLSGAAATKAALAWLGGGTVASGGGGAAWGAAAVGGIVTVALVAATTIGMGVFQLYEKSEQNRLLECEFNELEKGTVFNKRADKLFH